MDGVSAHGTDADTDVMNAKNESLREVREFYTRTELNGPKCPVGGTSAPESSHSLSFDQSQSVHRKNCILWNDNSIYRNTIPFPDSAALPAGGGKRSKVNCHSIENCNA